MEKRTPTNPETQSLRDELLSSLEVERAHLAKISADLAGTALTDAFRADALIAADALVKSATDVRNGIVTAEAYEEFGGEESYWTVYRMFASEKNRGRLWSIEEIWNYLVKTYDMAKETYETVETTLLEWGVDIEQDAASRAGIKGSFIRHSGAFALALSEYPLPSTTPPKVVRVPRVKKQEALQAVVEEDPLFKELKQGIKAILSATEDGEMKQSLVKKALAAAAEHSAHFAPEQLQKTINTLVANNTFYKFRRAKVTHLSLVPRDDELVEPRQNNLENENSIEEIFDIPLSLDILRSFCAPGMHVQQKMTLNDLWRKVRGIEDRSQAPPDEEIQQIKQICNRLKTMGLVTAGGEKRGTSGVRTHTGTSSKHRRSATAHVYRVGLVSQEIKKELQDVLFKADAEAYMQAKL
ncbi:MAG: hypothetical protein ACOH18_00195 [Candidatus Saccharimonadaceae bacterium]